MARSKPRESQGSIIRVDLLYEIDLATRDGAGSGYHGFHRSKRKRKRKVRRALLNLV